MLKQDLLSFGKKGIGFPILITIPLLWLFTTGCDGTFKPWQENNQYFFSVYGYLDASADTQWVRVMPVREEFFLDPDQPLDAKVTLEHVESGESVIMNDSLFTYAHGVYAYNFWTTMELQPQQTYRLRAERSDGKYSHTKVSLPADFPIPLVLESANNDNVLNRLFVYIEGVERLADVQTLFHISFMGTGEKALISFSHLEDTTRRFPNNFEIWIDAREEEIEIEKIIGNPGPARQGKVTHKQIFIASAGLDYPHFATIGEPTVFRPNGISNIENGVGYLAGIASKTIPYESCMGEGMVLIPCKPEPSPW